ncbi:asparagine synthase (glutamine-hydrolyzing) [soil metagenome]
MPVFFVDIYNMCGIAGIVSRNSLLVTKDRLIKMIDAVAHRGPDGAGYWISEDETVGLGHRRLAIIDLSINGIQPMHFNNNSGDLYSLVNVHLTITYNGEIYNYIELKDILYKKGYRFTSTSDTEVILAAYDCWKENCLQYFDGMFSFAIWDKKEQTLFAARDRFGEKPFYYYEDNNQFVFGSEMKALWAAGIFKKPDEKMLLNFLTLGYVQNANDKEQTFFQEIYSLPPAHYLKISLENLKAVIHPYWSIDKENSIKISSENALEEFESLFKQSISRRLRSDVPVGTSLSGGLDSSSIVTVIYQLQQKQKKLKTFSAVFPGFERDESAHIKAVVKKFQLQNFQATPNVDGFIKDFQSLCYHQEEPFTSSSIYAQFKVFELAKQHDIKVLLDGQGADETHAGYHKYIHWYLQQLVSRKKFLTAKREKDIFRKKNISFKWGTKNYLAAYFPAHASLQLEKNEYQRSVRQPDINPDFIVSLRGREWEGIHKPIITKLNDILFFNTHVMGLEELLRFADRNSMAHGREVRLPFLSHKLVEFIFSLPAHFKIQDGWTKWLLRTSMNKKLPDSIVWRTEKVGFETPQKEWLKNERMADFIHESKRKLVNNHILKSTVLDKKVIPRSAYDADNFDWRYLCAAQIL